MGQGGAAPAVRQPVRAAVVDGLSVSGVLSGRGQRGRGHGALGDRRPAQATQPVGRRRSPGRRIGRDLPEADSLLPRSRPAPVTRAGIDRGRRLLGSLRVSQ